MQDCDFIYGCRSGIQKGIRRGDLDLVHTCFEALWEKNDQHRDWLKWRTWSITIEECFHLIGDLARLLDSGSGEKKDWQKFIFRLCIATKSKDCPGLWSFIHNNGQSSHAEFKELRFFRRHADREFVGDYLKLIPAISEAYRKGSETRQLDKYELDALDVLVRRATGGGMLNDRYFALTGMILLFLRGINRDSLIADLRHGRERWVNKVNGRTKPKLVNLPWHVFDKHTDIGRMSLNAVKERWNARKGTHKFDTSDIWTLWFYLESAKTGKDMIRVVPENKKNLTALDSVWWLALLRHKLGGVNGNLTPGQCAQIWKTGGLAELAEEVTWEMIERRNLRR